MAARIVLGGARGWGVLAPAAGRVVAVFERSVYLESDAGIACLGPESLRGGPLNLLCRARTPIAGRLERGATWCVTGSLLAVGAGWQASLGARRRWTPPAAPRFDALTLSRRLADCGSLLRDRAELGPVLPHVLSQPPSPDPVGRAFGAALPPFDAWLAAALSGACAPPAPELLDRLLGLGPGLTPSGDDFLAGAAVALHALGEVPAARALGDGLSARAPLRTSAISAAHLAAACDGQVMASLHDAIGALAHDSDAALDVALESLAAVGHTSGLDALAGVLLVAARWLDARPSDRGQGVG